MAVISRTQHALALCVGLAAAITVLVLHFNLLVHTPLLEVTDYAANAMQITNAKRLNEIYGNYSRWGFRHPGPAFFYVLAFGELLLFDLTRAVASPHAAHILAGSFLQGAFIGYALAIMARYVALTWFLPIAGAVMVAHLAFVHGSIDSIWLPDMLFGPFLTLLVSCAAVAVGHIRWLPLVAISGVFLCHGHVAQPLQVVPLVLAAVSCFLLRNRRPPVFPIVASGLIVLAGLIPILLDAIRGSESNLAAILRHMEAHRLSGHELPKAAAYLLRFFVYERDNIPLALLAIAAVVGTSFVVTGGRPFVAALVLLSLLATLTSLQWARMQDGELYPFNTYYFYAVVSVLYLVPVAGIAMLLQRMPPIVPSLLLATGCAAMAVWLPPYYAASRQYGFIVDDGFAARLLATLPSRPVIEMHFYPQHWQAAVFVANALDRSGRDFSVGTVWWHVFGSHRTQSKEGKTALVFLNQNEGGIGLQVPSTPTTISYTRLSHVPD